MQIGAYSSGNLIDLKASSVHDLATSLIGAISSGSDVQ